MTKPVDYAMFYASKGWQVFPCKPKDKTPMVKWADEATSDIEKIKAWWSANESYNIGIATGARSGIVVLDVDAGHGGDESLSKLTEANGALPLTVTALTGGGGHHYVFEHPGYEIRNSASKIGQGIDVRGDGGYIVAAPSVHPNGNQYRWVTLPSNTQLAALPEWLATAMHQAPPSDYSSKEAPQQTEHAAGAAYTSGSRNSTLASLAGTMRRRGMSEQTIYAALMVENEARCVPPLSIDEVKVIASSVARYDPKSVPVTNKLRERIQVEWLFTKCIYENPGLRNEFEWVTASMFSDENLNHFWREYSTDATIAAINAGILSSLRDVEPEIARVEEYANAVARFGYLDNIANVAKELEKSARDGNVDHVKTVIASLSDNSPVSVSSLKTAKEGLDELLENINDPRVMMRTGIQNFDRVIGGLERKKLSILAARPSVGKTTLSWQIARNMAGSHKKVIYFSLEVDSMTLWRKAALGIAEVSYNAVVDKNVSEKKMLAIQNEIIPDILAAYGDNLFLYDDPCTTDTIWKIVMQHAPDVVIIDHLGYIDDRREMEDVHRLGIITKRLKQLAKAANCHVMLIHQLSRASEKRSSDDRKPQLSDLRDSGHVEQDADIVIMPYRPDYYDMKDSGRKPRYSETQLMVRKNRDGAAGIVVALFMDLLQQWFYQLQDLPTNWKNVYLED